MILFKDVGFSVTNTQTRGGYIFFFGVADGALRVGDELKQEFDEQRRWLIMKNHTGWKLSKIILNYYFPKAHMY